MRLVPVMALLISVSVSACGADGSGPSPGPDPGPVATQLVFTVQPSASTAGQAIAPPVQVAVHDAFGTLVTSADNAITLELQNNPSGAALTGTTTVGADSGAATFSDLQISKPGAGYTLRASASTLTGATSAAFDVSPVPGLATAMAPVAGDDQTATVGERVATSPSVRVTDGLGDPVANVGVTFSIGSGEGSASGAAQTTDAAGVATVGGWTLGTVAETNTLLAAVPGLDGSPVTFTATAVAAAAVALAMYDGDDQSAGVGTPVDPPSVLVTDTYGNGVANVTVTFAVTSGGGSITDPIQTTGTDGVAAVGSWTLGGALGDNTLSATSAGLSGSPVTFTATAISPPAGITVEVRNNYFLSLQNGSGNGTGFLENYATDTIPVGARVTWVWVGQNHNVSVAFSGLNLSGTHSAPFSYSRTYTTPGTYFYRCTNHSQVFSYPIIQGMVGIIVVQ